MNTNTPKPYYIERIDKNNVILHEEESEIKISRIQARGALGMAMLQPAVMFPKGMAIHIWEEALAEMDKDAAGFVTEVRNGR